MDYYHLIKKTYYKYKIWNVDFDPYKKNYFFIKKIFFTKKYFKDKT